MATTMTRVEKDSKFSAFWQGNVFYKSSKDGSICDSLNICKLLGIKYINQADKIMAGDFCLIK